VQRVAIIRGRDRHVAPGDDIGIGPRGDSCDVVLGVQVIGVEAQRGSDVVRLGRGVALRDLPIDDRFKVFRELNSPGLRLACI